MPAEQGSNASYQPLWVQALVAAAEPKIRQASQVGATGQALEGILNSLPAVVCVEDWGENMLSCANQRALAFFGLYLTGKRFGLAFVAERIFPPDRQAYQAMRQQLLQMEPGLAVKTVLRMRDAAGDWRWMSCWLTVQALTSGGLPEQVLWSLQDVTDEKQNEEKLRRTLYHDPLTGLYNRTYFNAELARLNGGREYPVGVIMIDIDSLKQVNDRLGHAAGDAMLDRLGVALKGAFRHGDVVARIGGDEFAVLLPRTSTKTLQIIIERIGQHIQKSNHSPLSPRLEISLGLAVAEQGQALERVLHLADQRMYQEKARHKQSR